MSLHELSLALKLRQSSEDIISPGISFEGIGTKSTDNECAGDTMNEVEREENRQRLEKELVPLVYELKLHQSSKDPKRRGRVDQSVKNALLYYKFGDRTGKEAFNGLDVSDMEIVRIALIGPTGSGKSCFIGTCERSLFGEKRQTCFGQGSGSEGTTLLDEYMSRHTFQMIDTRGFFDVNTGTVQECLNILSGRIQAGEEIYRNDDETAGDINGNSATSPIKRDVPFSKRVHGVIIVVKADDPKLRGGSYTERMKTIREYLRKEGHVPVTVITCEDSLSSADSRKEALTEACAATGSLRENTFFVTNYTHEHKEFSLTTEQSALDIMYSVLKVSEQFVKTQKSRSVNRTKQSAVTSKWAEHSIKQFFSHLQEQHDWDLGRVNCIVKELEEQEIHTVTALKECWEELKSKLGMTFAMRKIVEMNLP